MKDISVRNIKHKIKFSEENEVNPLFGRDIQLPV